MRELKFRVWDKKLNKWADEQLISDVVKYDHQYMSIGNALYKQRFTIEQYAEFNDKNGVEIYEGDILQEVIDADDEEIDGLFIYVVEWDEYLLAYKLKMINANSVHDELFQVNKTVEVIGSIHENPELLEA